MISHGDVCQGDGDGEMKASSKNIENPGNPNETDKKETRKGERMILISWSYKLGFYHKLRLDK